MWGVVSCTGIGKQCLSLLYGDTRKGEGIYDVYVGLWSSIPLKHPHPHPILLKISLNLAGLEVGNKQL